MPLARRRSFRVSLFAALALWLLNAAPVFGQSILDAQRAEFTPSPANNAVDATGVPLVSNYTLTVYVAGASTASATANLGKPTPDPDGMMRVAFSTLLS